MNATIDKLDAALQSGDAHALWNLGSSYLALEKFDEAQRALHLYRG